MKKFFLGIITAFALSGITIFTACSDPVSSATYAITVNQPPVGGTFTVSVRGGAPVDTNTRAEEGMPVVLTAFPVENFHWTSFTVIGASGNPVLLNGTSNNIRYFTMPAEAVTVTAVFTGGAPVPFDITVVQPDADEGAFTVSVAGGNPVSVNTTANKEQPVTLTALPAGFYQFVEFTVTKDDGTEVDLIAGSDINTFTFTMPEDNVTVTAAFILPSFDIVLMQPNPGSGGTITVSVDGAAPVTTNTTAVFGQPIIITAIPDSNFVWTGFSVGAIEGGIIYNTTGTEYSIRTFTMPAADI